MYEHRENLLLSMLLSTVCLKSSEIVQLKLSEGEMRYLHWLMVETLYNKK